MQGAHELPPPLEGGRRRKALIQTQHYLSVFNPPPNYSDKYSTFSKKAVAPPDVPLVFI